MQCMVCQPTEPPSAFVFILFTRGVGAGAAGAARAAPLLRLIFFGARLIILLHMHAMCMHMRMRMHV